VTTPEPIPDEIDALKAALAAERTARRQTEARASGAEAMAAHLKLLIARMKREQYGQSSERGRHLLDQLEFAARGAGGERGRRRSRCHAGRHDVGRQLDTSKNPVFFAREDRRSGLRV